MIYCIKLLKSMGHTISALVLKGDYDQTLAQTFDLRGINLGFDLHMFLVDLYYVAYWQAKLGTEGYLETNQQRHSVMFPNEMVVPSLLQKIAHTRFVTFAIIATDYFGGAGDQYAQVYQGDRLANHAVDSINTALEWLGVVPDKGKDAFDTVGLSNYRSTPDYLEKYEDLADRLGV